MSSKLQVRVSIMTTSLIAKRITKTAKKYAGSANISLSIKNPLAEIKLLDISKQMKSKRTKKGFLLSIKRSCIQIQI